MPLSEQMKHKLIDHAPALGAAGVGALYGVGAYHASKRDPATGQERSKKQRLARAAITGGMGAALGGFGGHVIRDARNFSHPERVVAQAKAKRTADVTKRMGKAKMTVHEGDLRGPTLNDPTRASKPHPNLTVIQGEKKAMVMGLFDELQKIAMEML